MPTPTSGKQREYNSALVIGGTGFVGRHTVAELLANGYDVTTLSRDDLGYRFGNDVAHVTGDRNNEADLISAAETAGPDLVVDCAAFRPNHVRTALSIFEEAAYLYVSSGGVYDAHTIPKREGETPLHDCTPAQADDTSMATYGPRKAEADRVTAEAAARGRTTFIVRPTMVYGPKTVPGQSAAETGDARAAPASWSERSGLQTHHDYWIDRLHRYDRVVVPGDGTAIWHRAYVEDIASAIRIVAERGVPGGAYNVGDRRVCTMEDVITLIADALETGVEVVHTSERELAAAGLDPDDFVLYHHIGSRYPHVLDTCKLAGLGWTSTPVEVAMDRTVEESLASERTGEAFDPGREPEEKVIESLTD